MSSSARLGDVHVCPLPGHGTTPVVSASSNVEVNHTGAARVGDACGCGAVIITGFPSIQINGRPMAHLGSVTSHGGIITTGSGDTYGGFVIEPADGAAIINFATLGAIRTDGSVDEEKMASLLADPQIVEKAEAANALVDPVAAASDATSASEAKPQVCTHPDQMAELASYIADEINRNIHHPSVKTIAELLSYDVAQETRNFLELPWYAQVGATSPQAIAAANAVAAMALWTERVGEHRPWDHKPKIRKRWGDVWHKQGDYDYYYDIWSNIHYGYVGRRCGFSESVLLDGAGAEQIISDIIKKARQPVMFLEPEKKHPGPQRTAGVDGLRAWDDIQDRISIGIGIKLFERQPSGGITAEMIMREVLMIPSTQWGKGTQPHAC